MIVRCSLVSVLLVITTSLFAPSVHAERRYALLIGANRGNAGDETLAYARRDARRLAELLKEMGGFAAETLHS